MVYSSTGQYPFLERCNASLSANPTAAALEGTTRAFSLFRRCIECSSVNPQCPVCAADEACTQFPLTCDQCPYRACVKTSVSGATNTSATPSSGPNIGAIAGGVIGGVAFIAIATYLIWRFFLRGRKSLDNGYHFEAEDDTYAEKEHRASAARRAARASTHTVHSVASSVMTRASNVIPIAFIPGITSRRDVDEDAPPVPSVPLQHQHSSPSSPFDEQPPHNSFHSDYHSATSGSRSPYVEEGSRDHYFLPSDLPFSSFSDDTESYRRSRSSVATSHFARQSLTPSLARQSIASTIYGDQVEATPARTATRGKASMVSVHSSSRVTPTGNVPEVPQIDYLKYGAQPGVSSAADSTSGAGPSLMPIANAEAAKTNSMVSGVSGTEEDDIVGDLAPASKPNLAAAIEEAARRASRQPTHGGLGSLKRDPSPFSDQHAVS